MYYLIFQNPKHLVYVGLYGKLTPVWFAWWKNAGFCFMIGQIACQSKTWQSVK